MEHAIDVLRKQRDEVNSEIEFHEKRIEDLMELKHSYNEAIETLKLEDEELPF